jgi:RNA polymerase sigma-70 factor (ECF subfamily)
MSNPNAPNRDPAGSEPTSGAGRPLGDKIAGQNDSTPLFGFVRSTVEDAFAHLSAIRGSAPTPDAGKSTLARQERRIDEATLIREAQRGNPAAFEELVRKYDESVLRLALHLTRDEQDAQAVYQDAFLKAYRNIGSFRFECSFYTWIYRIVTNLCLDHLRKKNVREEDSLPVEDALGGEYDLLDQATDPMAHVELELYNSKNSRLDAKLVAKALDLPVAHIAQALGVSAPQVQRDSSGRSLQEELAKIAFCYSTLRRVLGTQEKARIWLNAPHPDLGARSPISLIKDRKTDMIVTLLQNALAGQMT